MKKYLFAAALVGALATPALADEVGVHVGPVGAGVTTGESHVYRDRDRDHVRIIREHPSYDRKTVIKRQDEYGNRSKTVIHHNDD